MYIICLGGNVEHIDDILITRAQLQSLYTKAQVFVRDTFPKQLLVWYWISIGKVELGS